MGAVPVAGDSAVTQTDYVASHRLLDDGGRVYAFEQTTRNDALENNITPGQRPMLITIEPRLPFGIDAAAAKKSAMQRRQIEALATHVPAGITLREHEVAKFLDVRPY